MTARRFPSPIATVDAVLLTLCNGALSAGLVRRDRPPHAGLLALPGGYVHVPEDADLEAAAARILREKTGVTGRFLEQLGTFSGVDRDPARLVAQRGVFRAAAGR